MFLLGLMIAGGCIWVGQTNSLTFLIAIVMMLFGWFAVSGK
ncbi:MAG: hypothetical protein WBP13_11235 [Methylophilaceae bacterium]